MPPFRSERPCSLQYRTGYEPSIRTRHCPQRCRRVTTAAILGAGELGGAIAHALARGDSVSRVWLVDAAGNAAAGKALDIQQAGAIEGFTTRLDGTSDVSHLIGSDVCVVADRFGSGSPEWHGTEGFDYLARIVQMMPDTPVVLAGVRQASLLAQLVLDAPVPRTRLI